ncbi:MAG: hypothetical protein COA69_03405 [Robiginitomaculum sp.]|nr:MAG: hypothetical protein COA69_03405 [Robiginitomaculum sp.]
MTTNKSALSPRQQEVLNFLALGYRIDEIAYEMNIKPETVNLHIGKLRSKLNARTNAQAVSIAYETNLIETSMSG